MNSLQDLVTGTVQEKTGPNLRSPLETWDKKLSLDLDEIEKLLRDLPDRLLAASPHEVPYLVAQAVSYLKNSRYYSSEGEYRALFLAATYSYNSDRSLLQHIIDWTEGTIQWIKDEKLQRAESAAIGSSDLQIELLSEFFTDDLAEELAAITSLKVATTKRWVRGGFSTSWSRHEKVKTLARIFYTLAYRKGLSREEALRWYRTPQSGGESPEDIMHSGRHLYSQTMRTLLKELD